MSTADYNVIQSEIAEYEIGDRTTSAALLAWFLNAVWRVGDDADDAICDGGGDKGIDALVVNDDLREITLFQAKHFKDASGTQGDKDLKNLFGAAAYFKTPEALDGLIASKPNQALRNLLTRQNVRKRLEAGEHTVRLVFVTDGTLDSAGGDFVRAMELQDLDLDAWDQPRLAAVAERTAAPELRPVEVKLKAVAPPTQAKLDGSKIAIGLIPARELIEKLPDIDTLRLFDRNVRLSEGRTRVNKDLEDTIKKQEQHAFFPAYHNGITVLTHGLEVRGKTLTLDHVTVVNGCQSLLALSNNAKSITDDLGLLVKVVEVPEQSRLIEQITHRSNNQNPVDIRDQRSTDQTQRGLRKAVEEAFGNSFEYEIREGEKSKAAKVLNNQEAAQLLMAVYNEEPWNAVRKVRLFDSEYRKIFDRRVTPHRLYLIRLLGDAVQAARGDLRSELASSFASVRFTLAYLLAKLLQENDDGATLLQDPAGLLPDREAEVVREIELLLDEVVESVNFHIEEETEDARKAGNDFDAKTVFKSSAGVRKVEDAVVRHFRRQAKRDPTMLFSVADEND